MSKQLTLWDTTRSTCSRESVDGRMPCDLPDGRIESGCSPVVVPARRSHQQERRKRVRIAVKRVLFRVLGERESLSAVHANTPGLPMLDISGLKRTDSSPSTDLQRSLESKLRERMADFGSPEFELRWNSLDMPLGPWILQRAASARRTSDSDFTGWPTPQAHDTREQGSGRPLTVTGCIQCHNGETHSLNLPGVAALACWPTPMASSPATETYNEAGSNDSSRRTVAMIAGWATPAHRDGKGHNTRTYAERGGGKKGEQLPNQVVHLVGWATPTTPRANDSDNTAGKWYPNRNQTDITLQILGRDSISCPAETESKGALSPEHSRWLMGFPIEWSSCADTAMQSFRKSPPSSSKHSSNAGRNDGNAAS